MALPEGGGQRVAAVEPVVAEVVAQDGGCPVIEAEGKKDVPLVGAGAGRADRAPQQQVDQPGHQGRVLDRCDLLVVVIVDADAAHLVPKIEQVDPALGAGVLGGLEQHELLVPPSRQAKVGW